MNTEYKLLKRSNGSKKSYGIKVIYCTDDIFSKKSEAKKFINICNKMQLSEIHLEDVLTDYLIEHKNII